MKWINIQNKILNEEIEVIPKSYFRKKYYKALKSKNFKILKNFSFLANFIYYALLNEQTNRDFHFSFLVISVSTTTFYSLETIFKIYCYGIYYYFREYWLIFQFLITLSFQIDLFFKIYKIENFKNHHKKVGILITTFSIIKIAVFIRFYKNFIKKH